MSTDRPGSGTGDDLRIRGFALIRGQQLAVGKTGNLPAPAFRKYDGSDDQRAGARSAPGFVDPGNMLETHPTKGSLVAPEARVAAGRSQGEG